MKKYIHFVCLVFAVRTVSSQLSKNCLTKSNLKGVCININLCPLLQTLNEMEWKNSSVISILRESICGYEFKQYKVCCLLADSLVSNTNSAPTTRVETLLLEHSTVPTIASSPNQRVTGLESIVRIASDSECKTPNQLNGTCINIQRCILLDSMFNMPIKNESIENLLSKSICGYDGIYPKVCCPLNSNYVTAWSPYFPSRSTCGMTHSKDKVVGGNLSELGAWPWMAALGYNKNDSDIQWLCGGTLISNIYVLTAAHCTVRTFQYKLKLVHLGDLDLNPAENDGATPINYTISRIIVHENYDGSKFLNDIALLKLNDTVVFTDLILPICLPILSKMREHMLVNFYPYVAGWGSPKFRGPRSTKLMQVQVPIRDNKDCKRLYEKLPVVIDERVLCAGEVEGGKDSCQGDSGGPLMWPTGSQYYLVGIVSFGVGCAQAAYPGVYTRVSTFIDWIVNNMNKS